MLVIRRFVAVTAAVLMAAGGSSVATIVPASGAADSCSSSPRVVAITAEDVAFLDGHWQRQQLHVLVQNPCGALPSCGFGATPSPCTRDTFGFQRTDAPGSEARSCGNEGMGSEDYGGGQRLPSEQPGEYDYPLNVPWSLGAADEYVPFQRVTNACAGRWDVTATVTNWDASLGSFTGDPFTQRAAFSLHRLSRLTTNASPEPVDPGGTVTVKGRVTRQTLAPERNADNVDFRKYVAFGGQSVILQRRTLTGAYRDIRSVRSNRRGYLTTKLKALPEERCYRWSYPGSATTLPVTGGGDCVPVRH